MLMRALLILAVLLAPAGSALGSTVSVMLDPDDGRVQVALDLTGGHGSERRHQDGCVVVSSDSSTSVDNDCVESPPGG